MQRQLKKEVKIGNIKIGGTNPIAVQTMLNVPVKDIAGNVAQAERVAKAGCQIVRVTVPTPADAAVVAAIKEKVDRIGRSVTGRGPQARAKADGKFLDMDTAMARRHKVAQLMHQNDAAKHEQRCQPGQQCSHRHLTSKVLDVEL